MWKQGEGLETWHGLSEGELRGFDLAQLLPVQGSLADQDWSPTH